MATKIIFEIAEEEGVILNEAGQNPIDGQKESKVLKKFNMSDCKPSNTPCEVGLKLSAHSDQKKVDGKLYRQFVGSLLYLTINRLDIVYAVGFVSRYMANPHVEHWKAAQRILKYVKGT